MIQRKKVMDILRFIILLLLVIVTVCCAATSDSCTISINKQKPYVQPLLLNISRPEFLYPDSLGDVKVQVGQKIRLECPGESNSFNIGKPEVRDITAECVKGGKFKIVDADAVYSFDKLTCKSTAEATTVLVGNCPNSTFSRIKIGFALSTDFLTTIEVCFDQDNYDAVYSTFKLTPSIQQRQNTILRPDFNASFYDIDITSLYSRKVQRNTLAQILGSEELARKYIKLGFFNFIARGHLSANADFVYVTEQRSSFFYINTAPQWQLFNINNWVALEKSVRALAIKRKSELIVVTGTWGVSSLPDVNGKLQPLYMYVDENNNRAVQVPGYFWKIVYDPATKEGAAFVGVNNPHLLNVTSDKVFCEDICNRFDWISNNRHNVRKGYLFCCSVDEFRKTVTTAPDLQIDKIFS